MELGRDGRLGREGPASRLLSDEGRRDDVLVWTDVVGGDVRRDSVADCLQPTVHAGRAVRPVVGDDGQEHRGSGVGHQFVVGQSDQIDVHFGVEDVLFAGRIGRRHMISDGSHENLLEEDAGRVVFSEHIVRVLDDDFRH